MRYFISLSVFVVLLLTSSAAFSEIKEQSRAGMPYGVQGLRVDRVICVDGLKVFQTYIGHNAGVSVSTIQLYDTKDGKAVPATCK